MCKTPTMNLESNLMQIQTTQKTMHNQTLQKWTTVTRYPLSQTLMTNASQYIASKGLHTYITWPLPRRGFLGPIYKQVIYGCDQTSAYTGAAGSRYQSISDLTQHITEWNANTGNYMPYSLRQVCGFFYVPHDCVNSEGLWDGAYGL